MPCILGISELKAKDKLDLHYLKVGHTDDLAGTHPLYPKVLTTGPLGCPMARPKSWLRRSPRKGHTTSA